MVGVVGVGEGDLDPADSHTDLLEVEHGRGSRGKVRKAGPEEELGEIGMPPPPRDGPMLAWLMWKQTVLVRGG
jgi:hypothetical protein